MFKAAQEKIILVAPFIKINERLREILIERKNSGVIIVVVCKKEELKTDISDLATEIIDRKSLHAKCYMTESCAVITSMNLIEFSQVNNDEMGFFISSEEHKYLYNSICIEVNRICKMGIQNYSKIKNSKSNRIELKVGRKYSQDELDLIFDFIYNKPAGIKETKSGNVVLFWNTSNTKYKNEEINGILYYQGQNTGGEEQQLIYGNKTLYTCFELRKENIFLFKDNVYCGKHFICQKPFQKDGKWIFPLGACGTK